MNQHEKLENITFNYAQHAFGCNGGFNPKLKHFRTLEHRAENQE